MVEKIPGGLSKIAPKDSTKRMRAGKPHQLRHPLDSELGVTQVVGRVEHQASGEKVTGLWAAFILEVLAERPGRDAEMFGEGGYIEPSRGIVFAECVLEDFLKSGVHPAPQSPQDLRIEVFDKLGVDSGLLRQPMGGA
jgi:hypothetical protein